MMTNKEFFNDGLTLNGLISHFENCVYLDLLAACKYILMN